jgi:protein-disulfide isomerase
VPVLEQVLEQNPANVKIAFKNFPLRNHKFAMPSELAALAAGEQGKFWEFHDLLFENYNKLNDQKIQEIAQAVGLNQEEYEKAKKDTAIQGRVRQDLSDGRQAGVRGTPTIFINGIRIKDRSLKGFQAAIDKQLQKLGKTVTKPSS